MTKQTNNRHGRRPGRGLRPWLLLPKLAGVAMMLGGLAALGALGLFGPEPETVEGWRVLRGSVRTIVLTCVLPGALLAIGGGACLFLRHPGVFARLRWFRLKVVVLLVATPLLHFTARHHAVRLADAIEAGRLDEATAAWRTLTLLFVLGFVVYLSLAGLARHKPRLGEPIGRRRVAPADRD